MGHSPSAPIEDNPFIEMSYEWEPNKSFLVEEEQRLKVDIFPMDGVVFDTALREFISYRCVNDKRRRKGEEWNRLLFKSLVYQVEQESY